MSINSRKRSMGMERKHQLAGQLWQSHSQELPLLKESQGHRRSGRQTSKMLVRSMMMVYLSTRKSIRDYLGFVASLLNKGCH
jgi:hypothetical protein